VYWRRWAHDHPVINVRRATSDDAAVVAEIFLASFHATYDFPLAHSDDDVRGWVRDHLIPEAETWVADEDGHVAGMMVVEPGLLEQLYVAPDRLGRGIGRRLLDLAKDRSPDGLSLWTFQVNDRARRFYERNGFQAVEIGDGSTNEERQPDVRYAWPGRTD
jgi:GNAT superfamily N-acetyltransferase